MTWSEKQRQTLAERMRAQYTCAGAKGGAIVPGAPIWQAEDGQLQPRAIGMRMYAVASRDGYRVLPGGLTRVAAEADAEVVSMQRGGASKDTWVLVGHRAACPSSGKPSAASACTTWCGAIHSAAVPGRGKPVLVRPLL